MGCCPVATALPTTDDNPNDKTQSFDNSADPYQAGRFEADRLKDLGNGLFKQGKYQEALSFYSRAIVKVAVRVDEVPTRACLLYKSSNVHAQTRKMELGITEY